MDKKYELSLTGESWWNDLTMNEQNLLINMLFNMNSEDFIAYVDEIKNDKYVSIL